MSAITFLVIERDNFEGAAALFKKIFLVDFDEVDAAGFLVKRQVADLLSIKDPPISARFWTGLPVSLSDHRGVIVLDPPPPRVFERHNIPFWAAVCRPPRLKKHHLKKATPPARFVKAPQARKEMQTNPRRWRVLPCVAASDGQNVMPACT